jgi:protein-S-isoprenylcysteine O-methyltransferase Ste14
VSWLESTVPPPVVTLLVGAAMWWAAMVTPLLRFAPAVPLAVAVLVALAGITVEGLGALELLRHRTTVNPLEPCNTSTLVTGGVYRFTRNPIYLGDLLILIGWGLYLSNPLSIIAAFLFVPYISRFQMVPEERALSELFGASYAEFKKRVRRWV